MMLQGRGASGGGSGGVIPASYTTGGGSGGGFWGGAGRAYGGGGMGGGDGSGIPASGGPANSDGNAPTIGGGSDFLRAQRSGLADQIAKTPGLRERLAGMMQLEGTPQASMESFANRLAYTNDRRAKQGLPPITPDQMLFGFRNKSGKMMRFYGPINHGRLPGAVAGLQRNPALMKRMGDAIDRVLGGSNIIEGATDQGMPSDPNGRTAIGGFRKKFGGNVFNDWGGMVSPVDAARWRIQQQQAARGDARGRLFDAARDSRVMGFPSKIEGGAKVQIDLNGFPRGTKTSADSSGIFDQIELNRGRTMPVASEAD